MNERSGPACPVFTERSGLVARHTTDDEQGAILEKVPNTDIDAREDMFFIDVYTRRNMLDDVFGYDGVRAAQPLERKFTS